LGDDIDGLLEADVMARVDPRMDAPPDERTSLAVALEHESGVFWAFLVSFRRDAAVPYCVVEDAVVDQPHRGCGRAHAFFAKLGFAPISASMMREF
jgi:hypothetical protein